MLSRTRDRTHPEVKEQLEKRNSLLVQQTEMLKTLRRYLQLRFAILS